VSDIGKGSLVMVVRWPHPHDPAGALGGVFEVGGLTDATYCEMCGDHWNEPCAIIKQGALPLAWLRKIDPPALPEDVEHKEEQPA
jgi:hypothetical protein